MWTYIIAGLIALSALATITFEVKSYLNGVKQSGYDQCQLETRKATAKALAEDQARAAAASKNLTVDRAKTKVKIQTRTITVEKILEKPIYRNVCLDPAGLSCVNAAIAGKGDIGCRVDGPVPGAKPAG